ncbi:MAG: phospholipid carrier-dependent glycosyltransferase [Chthoniobacterales bacterium]|nr:phospholipid carrier-dependent glycosyltransferase [Chthoniobacterales bacterium]
MPSYGSRQRSLYVIGLALVLAAGILLRLPVPLFSGEGAPLSSLQLLHPNPAFTGIGFDENLYRDYVNSVIRKGLGEYPAIVDHYIEVQKTLTGSILPPMRFLYIFSAYLWHEAFGTEALVALHNIASLFSILGLLLATLFAWRLKGPAAAVAVGALMAFAPSQIHMSQHALVDGFFAFWAMFSLWLLWENLRAPRNRLWLVLLVFGLALMVITKENAAFVYIALLAIIAANRWLRWGVVTRELGACLVIGPLLGFVILVFLAGGIDTLVTTYRLSVSKNYQLVYAIVTGDGPWHRYLVDLLLVNPVILLLAVGALFRLDREQKPELFLAIFIGASYLVMCNLKYGMNLRYANMWDMPLCVLAFSQLAALIRPISPHRVTIMAAALLLICAIEMRQYVILFVKFPLYELVSEGLLRALRILKSGPTP